MTGTLSKKHGYAIRSFTDLDGKKHFYSVKTNTGKQTPDGHWLFIKNYANMAEQNIYVADIRVSDCELLAALGVASHYEAVDYVYGICANRNVIYNAKFINNLAKKFNI